MPQAARTGAAAGILLSHITHVMRIPLLLSLCVLSLSAGARIEGPANSPPPRRMSFDNRLLLNRVVLAGLKRIEVLLLAEGSADFTRSIGTVSRLVERLGGSVRRTEDAIGYVHVEVPVERLLELAGSPAVAAYQISSLSRASWYRNGLSPLYATGSRASEVTPIAAAAPRDTYSGLPPLSIGASRQPGYTADEDAGVGTWMASHPTFDGRGVTIAVVEGGMPSFTDPALQRATTLDGRAVPKIAGILNTIDPSQPDETRVVLGDRLRAGATWMRIGGRTYILPRPGTYRFGALRLPAGANLVHEFGVLQHDDTREVWLDTNGDASFQDESALADVGGRFEPRLLKLQHPTRADVSFVMSRGPTPDIVHIYVGRGSHETMALSVAAGAKTDERLAFGVAPGARLLLVRGHTSTFDLSSVLQGFIQAARDPRVDLVASATAVTMAPDTAGDFVGLLFRRLMDVYRKPIFISAGNLRLQVGAARSFGAASSVGGSLGPETLAALHGGPGIRQLMVHPIGAAGPSIDGAIKPDFLAPMERLSADVPWNRDLEAVPRHAPGYRIPPAYRISCCTSATAPYAAGVAALLISAARQQHVPYSAEKLVRAMKFSARFLPEFDSHEQGNGVLDVEAAWRALRDDMDVPRIVSSARIVHPLAQYAEKGDDGQGILEFEGWTMGMTGTREIRFRRESGPAGDLRYRLSWNGNDGTFSAPSSVILPLGRTVAVPIAIAARLNGVHSALLSLRDEASNRVVFRTQTTIVAAEQFDPATRSARVAGRVGPLKIESHYFQVPLDVAALRFELEVRRGSIAPWLVPAHGLFPNYYFHVHPAGGRYLGKGRHTVTIPEPAAGTWALYLDNSSIVSRSYEHPGSGDEGEAEYALTVGIMSAAVGPARRIGDSVHVDAVNLGRAILEPVFLLSGGARKIHRAAFPSNGLARLIDITVPKDAGALILRARARHDSSGIELFLYDCTTGECFSYDLGFPAAPAHTMVVRRPNAGRWVAAINPAPFPAPAGGFELEEILTASEPLRHRSTAARPPGARWSEQLNADRAADAAGAEGSVAIVELIDAAAERDESAHPWNPRAEAPEVMRLRDRPVSLGFSLLQRRSN